MGFRVSEVEGVYRLRNSTPRCLAALVLAGVSLAGCGTLSSNTSTSFVDGGSSRLDIIPSFLRGSVDSEETVELSTSAPRPEPLGGEALLAGVRPQILDPKAPLECVPFARDASGIAIRGNANRWWQLAKGKYTRSRRPDEGAVFVMKGYQTNRRGHVAVVRQVLDDRTIVVDHANWGNDGRIYLSAPIRDESPKNDWSKVRVWYTPTGQWGRRIYRAKGFILPTTAVAGSNISSVVSGSY